MNGPAGGFVESAQEGDHRSLAVGAGDVDGGRQMAFGVTQRREQSLDTPERQIDCFGVEALDPLESRLATPDRVPPYRLCPPAGCLIRVGEA